MKRSVRMYSLRGRACAQCKWLSHAARAEHYVGLSGLPRHPPPWGRIIGGVNLYSQVSVRRAACSTYNVHSLSTSLCGLCRGGKNVGGMKLSIYQLVSKRVLRHFCIRLHAHFFEDTPSIGVNGVDAEVHFFRDFLDRFPGGDKTEELEFAVR